MNIEKSENLKNISEVVKNIFLTLSIAIGGGWIFLEYVTLYRPSIAEQQLKKLEIENYQYGDAEFGIEGCVVKVGEDVDVYLIGTLTINNPGNIGIPIEIDPKKPPITLSKVAYDQGTNGLKSTKPLHYHFKQEGQVVQAMVITPNQKQKFSFAMPIDKAGLYKVDFRANIQPGDDLLPDFIKKKIKDGNPVWTAERIFNVGVIHWNKKNNTAELDENATNTVVAC